MGSIGGEGPMAIGILWMMVGVSLPLALLRYYTRRWVTNSVALDDYIYSIGWLCLFLYVAFMTVSGYYGFGQNIDNLSRYNAGQAFMWEIIAQSFTVSGMGFAKTANALFLLRIVVERWHKWFLISIIVLHAVLCPIVIILLFVQCIPFAALWDHSIQGNCYIRDSHISVNLSVALGALFVAADFIFAVFPWVYIWNLKMPRKDKLVIAGSLSLSVLAGICGIFRSLFMSSLASPNYTRDTIGLVLLAAAEQAITMICIGIPQLRPLWRKAIRPWIRGESYKPSYAYGSKYGGRSGAGGAGGGGSYANNRTGGGGGGGDTNNNTNITNKSIHKSSSGDIADEEFIEDDRDSGWAVGGSSHSISNAYASRGYHSEDYILEDMGNAVEKGHHHHHHHHSTRPGMSRSNGGGGIQVTNDVRIEVHSPSPTPTQTRDTFVGMAR